MTIPFDLELARMALRVDTGYIATMKGDVVEIITWEGKGGYIYGKVHSGLSNIIFHCAWDTAGKIITSKGFAKEFGNKFDLVIKPTISL